jgi:hypothetical protein
MVYAIRTWRPEVILTHEPEYGDYNKFGHKLTGRVATRAFASAADPAAFPEHLEEAGLDPWQVQRLYYNMNHPIDGGLHPPSLAIDLGGYSAQLGCTHVYRLHRAVHYYWSKGRKEADVIPRWEGSWQGPIRRYHLARSIGPDVFGDIIPDREELSASRAASLTDAQAQEAAEWEEFMSELTRKPEDRGRSIGRFMAEQTAHPMVPVLALNRAREVEAEDPEAALALFGRFVVESPDREEAYRACLRTIDLLERLERPDDADSLRTGLAAQFPDMPEAQDGWLALARRLMRRDDYQAAWEHYRMPPVDWNPSPGEKARTQFEMGNAARLAGDGDSARKLYASSAESADGTSVWVANARAELDILSGKLPSASRIAVSVRTGTPPMIDGRLTDPVWLSADPVTDFAPLHVAWFDQPQPTEAWFAYDDDALYVAARCSDRHHETLDSGTIQDHTRDLWRSNYLAWIIDPPRTYLPGRDHWGKYWLVFAGTGPDDNRQWPAVAHRDSQGWTAEAAIPWSRLAAKPSAGDVWAVNIYREREAPTAVPAEGGFRWVEKTLWALPYVHSRVEPWLVGYLMFR